MEPWAKRGVAPLSPDATPQDVGMGGELYKVTVIDACFFFNHVTFYFDTVFHNANTALLVRN